MNKATKEKAMQAIRTFLVQRGFEIVEDGWKSGKNRVDFVAREDDDLVFVNCHVHTDTGDGVGCGHERREYRKQGKLPQREGENSVMYTIRNAFYIRGFMRA